MSGPYPLATLAAVIDADGISAPAYSDILASLIASMQAIFGSDIYLTPDTQDYQMVAIVALAINDTNQEIIATYNNMSPDFAQGVGLSALVKINGLKREAATNSTAALVLIGVAGTVIANGIVQDANGNLWNLPASVTIPLSGTITVTATAQSAGATVAAPNTITQMFTVILGWQSVTNPAAAIPGADVESDAALRARQTTSTSLASVSPLGAIIAAVANVPGVERYAVYENNTGSTDGNGVPGHSISAVVQGGDVDVVAQTIEQTKSPGTGTYGTTNITVEDPAGVPIVINFFELADVPIYVDITIHPLAGYVATTGALAQQAIVDFINGLAIGEELYYNWLLGAATLYGNPLGQTYHVTALTIGLAPAPAGTADIPIAFNAAATAILADVILSTV